ncbi:MAG: DNA-directed RNA polymerase subunit beta', partial [Clostridia bacterium]
RYLMLASNNILKLSDGKPVIFPTQDMVLGCYYLTTEYEGSVGEGKVFTSKDEAEEAYLSGDITLQSIVEIRVEKKVGDTIVRGRIKTSLGRMIFNDAIPQDLGIAERTCPEDAIKNEIEFLVGKKQLQQIIERCYKVHGTSVTVEMLDAIKSLGYKYSTISGITTSLFDMHIPSAKKEIIAEAEKEVVDIEDHFNDGLLTENERYKETIEVWTKAANDVSAKVKEGLNKYNPIWIMADSGARGSMDQIRQLCGMRGLMSDPSGKTIELPVKSCFREGLSVLEYFISTHGGRKGMADTALKTADSGYLTRRLVDVSHDVIIREDDCSHGGRPQGMWIKAFTGINENEVIEKFIDRIIGKVVIDDIINP